MLRKVGQGAIATAALALVVFAWRCDGSWFERHVFLPQQFFVVANHRIVLWTRGIAIGSALLLFVLAARMPRPDVARRSLTAVVLALVAAECLLEWRLHRLLNPGLADGTDTLTVQHPIYGATLRPGMDRIHFTSGRQIRVQTDAVGRRFSGAPIDPTQPSLVFTGESTVAGIGVQWEETFPAILGARLQSQVVNLASPGYRVDQSWQRLGDELPRLDHPIAVIGIFMPGLIGRSFANQAHPPARLSAGGHVEVLPLEAPGLLQHAGLYRLWKHLYWSDPAIEDGIRSVSAVMHEMGALARARGAPCIFVVTGSTPSWMLHAVFDGSGVDYAVVEVRAHELLADSHPGPSAHRRIADALEPHLRVRLPHW